MISISSKPTIYLDTQDFSRFGDVIRGRSNHETEQLFLYLERRAVNGDILLPISMPILGELLQYDADHRETTICKAQAVERLCGEWALPYPTRLVAYEIASQARKSGHNPNNMQQTAISGRRYWYPNVSNVFVDFEKQLMSQIDDTLKNNYSLNRANRRKSKKLIRKIDFADIIRANSEEICQKFGLPSDIVERSLVALSQKKITAEEASKRLFAEISRPTNFVEIYFEKLSNDRSLPFWISGLGRHIEDSLHKLRADLKPEQFLIRSKSYQDAFFCYMRDSAKNLVRNFIDSDSLKEFDLTQYYRNEDDVAKIPVEHLPSANVIARIMVDYVKQVFGVYGTPSGIERSFGGDLIHALYLPHVDLWRGDRRFSTVVRRALPEYADRIVSNINDLTGLIEKLLMSKQ